MREAQAYSIVQFMPDPDRKEAVNIGVVLFDPRRRKVFSKFTDDFSRVSKLAKKINRKFLDLSVSELKFRIEREAIRDSSFEHFEKYASMRSNNFRFTKFLPTFGLDPVEELEVLFSDLVGEETKITRKTRVSTKLKSGLKQLGVLNHFDVNPEPISLPRYRLKIRPDLAIRRAQLNVLEAARFDDPETGLVEAGRHALAGRALQANLNIKLIVVGDFEGQPNEYFNAISEDLAAADTQLVRLDRLEPLVDQFASH